MRHLLSPLAFILIVSSVFAQTGNVGIGTSNPLQRLDVAGWVGLGDQTEGTTGTAGAIRYNSITKVIQYYDGTSWIDLLPAGAGGDDDWTISGSNMYNANSGNVAIGTPSYTEKLNVAGDVYIGGSGGTIGLSTVSNGFVRIGTTLGIDPNEIMFDIEGNIGTVGSQSLKFLTNGTTRVTIDASGNVGIGATSPTRALHVVGNMRVSALTNGIVKTDASGNFSVTTLTGSSADVLLGNGTFGPGSAFGDNLGNHTATQNLNMNSNSINNIIYANISSGTGNGIRFWSSDSYKIHMGNDAEYHYGPVTDYSIKTNMSSNSGRGWTWGIAGSTPVAAISNTGNLQIAGYGVMDGLRTDAKIAAPSLPDPDNNYDLVFNSGNGGLIYANGSTAPFKLHVQDGHGRVHYLWNVEESGGTYDYAVSGEGASWFLTNGGSFQFQTAPSGTAGDPISWNTGLYQASDGKVGIGTTSPSYELHVAGKIKSDGVTETSDVRMKTNIQPISNALEKILQVNGVTYNWRVDEFPQYHLDNGMQIGVIAQQLQTVFPELVNTDADGYLSVEYSHLVPVLIEAIKTQQQIIDNLKGQIGTNTGQISQLQAQLNQMQQQLNLLQPNNTITTNE